MTQMNVTYDGGLRCTLTHGPSGTVIQTDAPKDNQGQGAAFSPTDLASVSLGACMLTVMGIYARNHGVSIDGAQVSVSKEMIAQPLTCPPKSGPVEMGLIGNKVPGRSQNHEGHPIQGRADHRRLEAA